MRGLYFILAASLLGAANPGETLLYEQTREGVDRLLADCAARGVKKLEVVILPAGVLRPNAYGDYAMGYGGQVHTDISLPNPKFFQHLDWVMKRAASKQIEVAVLPVDQGSVLLGSNSTEKFYDWGRYLGRRYMKARNLVWLKQSKESSGSLLAIEEGIRQFDSKHRFELRASSI